MGRIKPIATLSAVDEKPSEVSDFKNLCPKEFDSEEKSGSSNVDSDSESEENESESEEDENAFDEHTRNMSYEELRQQGIDACKKGDYETGLAYLSLAVGKRVEEIGDETHPECADIWFIYGCQLLNKEERTGEFFKALESQDTEQNDRNDVEGAEPSDEQLAWQGLEIARLAFTRRLERWLPSANDVDQSWDQGDGTTVLQNLVKASRFSKSCKVPPWLEDFAFCYVRLGDMLQAQLQFEGAAENYLDCLKLAGKFQLSAQTIQIASVPLGHCYRAMRKIEAADAAYALSISTIESILVANDLDKGMAENYRNVLEDLKAQRSELEKLATIDETAVATGSPKRDLPAALPDPLISPPVQGDTGPLTLSAVLKNFGIPNSCAYERTFDAPTSDNPVVDLGLMKSKKRRKVSTTESLKTIAVEVDE